MLDATGQLAKEVDADNDLGLKLGLMHTPTIVVVTNKNWIQVEDFTQLDVAIDMARASVSAAKR